MGMWKKKVDATPAVTVAEIKQAVEANSNDKAETKDKKVSEVDFDKIIVVKELPMQPVRYAPYEDEKGVKKIAKLITVEEALTEMFNDED